jgi:hypothetical protein
MSGRLTTIADVLAPSTTAGKLNTLQRLTGTTSQAGAALEVGQMATLWANTDLYFRMGGTAQTAVATDTLLSAGHSLRWSVQEHTKHVAVLPVSGTVEATLWVSSGPG